MPGFRQGDGVAGPGGGCFLPWLSAVLAVAFVVGCVGLCRADAQPTLIVSSGLKKPSYLAVDTSGNVYVVDRGCTEMIGQPGDCNVYKETLSNGSYTQSLIASFTSAAPPAGVAVDKNGNVYIGVDGKGVYKETLSGNTYTESAVGCAFGSVGAIAIDGQGNLYVSSAGYIFREKETDNCGTVATLAGGADPVSGLIVAVDVCGGVYAQELQAPGFVWLETPSGTGYTQSRIIGTSSINGLAVDANRNVYVTGTDGTVYIYFPGSPGYSYRAVQSGFTVPGGIALDSAKNIYVVDGTFQLWKLPAVTPVPAPSPCPGPAPPTGLTATPV